MDTLPIITEHVLSRRDIEGLLSGEEGVDLAAILIDGEQVAMRIFGVAPGTTAARLGARNGDLIEAINGIPLTSFPAALEVGETVGSARTIEIRGTRNGLKYVTILHVA